MTTPKTQLSRAAALRTLELSEPPVCGKQTIARAHRALRRRYLPNEDTPPATVPYFRRIEKAYRMLETDCSATVAENGNTNADEVTDASEDADSNEDTDMDTELSNKRFTAPAFINCGLGSGTPSPTPSTVTEGCRPCNAGVYEAPPGANTAPRHPFTSWLLSRLMYLIIGLVVSIVLNLIGIQVFGEQFLIADDIAHIVFGTIFTVAGYIVGFGKGFLQNFKKGGFLEANGTMSSS